LSKQYKDRYISWNIIIKLLLLGFGVLKIGKLCSNNASTETTCKGKKLWLAEVSFLSCFLNFGLIKINGVICKLPDLYHFQVPYGHEPERTEINNKYNNIRLFLLYPLLVD